VCVALLGTLSVLFAFGTPQAASLVSADSASASTGAPKGGAAAERSGGSPAGSKAGYAGEVIDPDAEPPAADISTPLAIEIPGCVCHSDDPAIVKRHSAYRMNQCAGCHVGGVKTD
jgi:hypothetical protein